MEEKPGLEDLLKRATNGMGCNEEGRMEVLGEAELKDRRKRKLKRGGCEGESVWVGGDDEDKKAKGKDTSRQSRLVCSEAKLMLFTPADP